MTRQNNRVRLAVGPFMAAATLAVGLALIPATPAAAASSSTPNTSSGFGSSSTWWGSGPPSFQWGWSIQGSNCGFWGCDRGDYYFSSTRDRGIVWNFKQFQGKFDLRIRTPRGSNEKDKARVDGKIKFIVLEKRPGSEYYNQIRSATFTQHHKRSGWHTAVSNILLDGEVIVLATVVSGTVGLFWNIGLEHKDVLPAHKELVTSICIANYDPGLSEFLSVVSLFLPGKLIVRALTGTVAYFTGKQLETYYDKKDECQKYANFKRYAKTVATMTEQGRISPGSVIYPNEHSRSNWCPTRGTGVSKTTPEDQVC